MQQVFYVARNSHDWALEAAQSLTERDVILVIFERYNYAQRTLLYNTFKGYRIQKTTGAMPKEIRDPAVALWGKKWYNNVVKHNLVAYVQITQERIRTSDESVPRSQPETKHVAPPASLRLSNLELKRCNICGQELPKYVYFQKYYKTSTDPRQGYCKVCQKYYLRWWHKGKQAGTGKTFRQFCETDPDWKFETQFRL